MKRPADLPGQDGLTLGRAVWKRILAACLILLLCVLVGLVVHFRGQLPSLDDIARWSMNAAQGHWLLILLIVAYALLLAVPFIPGAELGIAIMVLFGANAAPVVLLATVLGLFIAFAVGRSVPEHRLLAILDRLGLQERGHFLSARNHPDLSEHDRLCALFQHNRVARLLLNWRYLAIAALLNLPGNVVVGGGGGISLLAGASRAFSPVPFTIAVALAASPIPLAVFFFGTGILGDGLIGLAKNT
ncbi:putative membrane protein YdjX (TVP38/TMEM64 family) [Rubricella aquisinus]|uniref:Putative membrane protein YdjX (TVP38/TMEM64 family) n=1 Tax=Rubricella aquisinus TaxID=2028108 RepID=A0A840WGM6_9RHOB|nr:hypothetical protein [Rubricella aquisinus]MBB5514289.1 putative membrane protein YdjX (TVP38/TMEM64 family) [Rubricella aquisinus]